LGGGETYQQNSVLRRDRDFLYKIPNEANIKCQLWYFIQWLKILPLGGVRPKFAKLGQFLEKSLLNKTFREHQMPAFLCYASTPYFAARGRQTQICKIRSNFGKHENKFIK
jgi:hypothetical protein